MKAVIIILHFLLAIHSLGGSNLGTINTIQNGLATIKECEEQNNPERNCNYDGLEELKGILNLTTTGQCLASQAQFQESGLQVPKCPESLDQLKGLDNTYPTGGIFALFTGDNANFIHNFVNRYLESTPVGHFNLVLPRDRIERLITNTKLMKTLNSERVNIVDVNTTPRVERWMQDSFQFTTINKKPAIYQLEHATETDWDESNEKFSKIPFSDRLACDLARKCDIPYYVPADMVDPSSNFNHTLNHGGNLEVLPGGTFYMGVHKRDSSGKKLDEIFRTPIQESYTKNLKQSGNRVLELDTSFLEVQHVDEIISVVKTDRNAPCDYAVLMASPNLAFNIMENFVQEHDFNTENFVQENDLKLKLRPIPMPGGGIKYIMGPRSEKSEPDEIRCPDSRNPDKCDLYVKNEGEWVKVNGLEMTSSNEGTEYFFDGKLFLKCSNLGECVAFRDRQEVAKKIDLNKGEIELRPIPMPGGGIKHIMNSQAEKKWGPFEVRCPDSRNPDKCDFYTKEEGEWKKVNNIVEVISSPYIEMTSFSYHEGTDFIDTESISYNEGTEYFFDEKPFFKCSTLGKCVFLIPEIAERKILPGTFQFIPTEDGRTKASVMEEGGRECEIRCDDGPWCEYYCREESENNDSKKDMVYEADLIKESKDEKTMYLFSFDKGFECIEEECSYFFHKTRCTSSILYRLAMRGAFVMFNEEEIEAIYNNNCVDGRPIESFVNSDEYRTLKNQNKEGLKIEEILLENRNAVLDELKKTTACESPPVIDIPVFFRSGSSFLPDLVNGVVETPTEGPSRAILPKTYFRPFDDYVKKELKKYGVDTMFVHDLEYHLRQGEVHCGTNDARICQ